ncbi:MAG: sugar phosphate isomerase/epimerase [Planctomycetaceae bacterium]|nr:sugar phosphate isomerase/epimerase [Planctomycetaceae bacterium]
MKRRQFLLHSAALTLGTALAAQMTAAQETKKGLKLGLTTYMIGSKWTIPELIEFLPKSEIFGTELRTDSKFTHGVELDSPKAVRVETAKRFADSPVKLVGVACGERYDSPDAEKLKKSIERTKELLQFCADLGAPGLRVFPNDFQKDVPQEKTLEQIADSLKKLAPTADSLGVELRLEAHGNAGLLPNLAKIAKAVNHPKVRLMLNSDIRDLKDAGLSANLEMVKPYLGGVVHIHELTSAAHMEAKFYETQFAFLKNAGWSGYCLLEIGDKPDNEARFAEIAKQKKRWDEIMAII